MGLRLLGKAWCRLLFKLHMSSKGENVNYKDRNRSPARKKQTKAVVETHPVLLQIWRGASEKVGNTSRFPYLM